jgi:hypothetical protein
MRAQDVGDSGGETGTIVLCDTSSLAMARDLEAAGFDVLGVTHSSNGSTWIGECSVAILRSAVAEPVVLIASGDRCMDLPSVGWARRSAHRPVGAYVLLNPTGTPAHRGQGDGDWPDAPVIVLTHGSGSEDERAAVLQSRLRGWFVIPYEDTPAAGVVEALRT